MTCCSICISYTPHLFREKQLAAARPARGGRKFSAENYSVCFDGKDEKMEKK
jgi:hypothetical protein